MKNRVALALSLVLAVSSAIAQTGQPARRRPPRRRRPASTDIYQVHVVKAAPGKTAELLNSLRTPPADTAMPTHALILRHLEGDDWDFAVIQHARDEGHRRALRARPGGAAGARAWHSRHATSRVPPWAEFSKAMGIGRPQAGAAPAGSDVYIVGVYQRRARVTAPSSRTR